MGLLIPMIMLSPIGLLIPTIMLSPIGLLIPTIMLNPIGLLIPTIMSSLKTVFQSLEHDKIIWSVQYAYCFSITNFSYNSNISHPTLQTNGA